MIRLPSTGVHRYEQIRADRGANRARRIEVAAIRFHGMVRGLIRLEDSLPEVPSVSAVDLPPSASCPSPGGADPALVRLMANMVLQIQSGEQHVY